MSRKQRQLVWLLAILASAASTAAMRASLRGQSAAGLWLAAVALALLLYAQWRRRWARVAVVGSAVLAGPAVSGSAVLALRTWVPLNGSLLSIPGVLAELARSPVFYVSVAFAVSWSLLGLWVRTPRSGTHRDRWSHVPFLVWSLLANRGQELYLSSSRMYDFPPAARAEILWTATWVLLISLLATLAATMPTLIQNRKQGQALSLGLPALLPVMVVLVDWGLILSILSRFSWLEQAG